MKYLALIILCLFLFASPLLAGETLDSICAVVDDEIILESEVAYGVSSLLFERGQMTEVSPEQTAELRRQVIKSYIIQKILLAKAAEDTLVVEDRVVSKELERRLASLVQQAGSEEKLIVYFGRAMPQIKRDLRKAVYEGLLIDKVRRQLFGAVYVSRQDVLNFFTEHQTELPTLPEQVELSHILLEVKVSEAARDSAYRKIEHILHLLQSGVDFDSLARVVSEDPSAEQGGRLGMTTRGDLVPEFEEAAYTLEPETISDIVQTRFGYHIIRLLERQGERIACQHILVKMAPTRPDWDATHQQAGELLERLKNSADFGALARQYSTDKNSRDKEGRLETMNTDDLPTAFRQAIDDTPQGGLTEPFETEFGVHLVRVDRRRPQRPLNINADYSTLEQYAVNFKREDTLQQWVRKQVDNHYIYPPMNW